MQEHKLLTIFLEFFKSSYKKHRFDDINFCGKIHYCDAMTHSIRVV